MKRNILPTISASIVFSVFLSGCATNWSAQNDWPKQHKFEGQEVHLCQSYVIGGPGSAKMAPGEKPATLHTYYAYMKDGKRVRHGKSTWWYSARKPKAEVTYVHGVMQDRINWYLDGGISERVTKTPAGEKAEFFDKSGKLIGTQLYDKKTKKLICTMGSKIVSLDEFMAEIGRVIYGQTRITP